MASWMPRSFDPPDAASVGTVRTQIARVAEAGFAFENGRRLPSLRVAFETYGVSMGGFQAAEWAVAFPDFADRIVIDRGTFRAPDLLVATTEARTLAIRSDPYWREGRYADEGVFPRAGMTIAGMILHLYATSQEAFTSTFGRRITEAGPSPYESLGGRFASAAALREAGEAFAASGIDPNAYLYNIRAIALHDVSHGCGSLEAAAGRVRARVLFFHCRSDLLVPVAGAREAHGVLRAAGVTTEFYEYDHPLGHLALSTPALRARWLPVLRDFLKD